MPRRSPLKACTEFSTRPLEAPLGGPLAGLQEALLGWFRSHHRQMPWRGSEDPYAIWVSEIMLQQTQVATVAPYYSRFMARFPTVESLAQADLDEVLVLWAGLGYYSRARNLHAAAKQVVHEFDGRFPDTERGVRSLPGIGPYTAGAILSIAFQQPVPAVDGNVERVICRLWELEGAPKNPPVREGIRAIAAAFAHCGRPGDMNQALMELGATVCTPLNPACAHCPATRFCLAREKGRQEKLPQTPQRRKLVRRVNAAAVLRDAQGRYLVARRPEGMVWGGLWEFPQAEDVGDKPEARLAEHLREALGLEVTPGDPALQIRHGIMDRAITLKVYECGPGAEELRTDGYADARWVAPADMGGYAFSSPHKKIVKHLLVGGM